MPESDLPCIVIPSVQTGYRPSRTANWELTTLWTRLEMSDISLKSSYVRYTPGKKSKYINARGKETEAVPISGFIQGQTTAHCITSLQKCGPEWEEVMSIHTSHPVLLGLIIRKPLPAHFISLNRCSQRLSAKRK